MPESDEETPVPEPELTPTQQEIQAISDDMDARYHVRPRTDDPALLLAVALVGLLEEQGILPSGAVQARSEQIVVAKLRDLLAKLDSGEIKVAQQQQQQPQPSVLALPNGYQAGAARAALDAAALPVQIRHRNGRLND